MSNTGNGPFIGSNYPGDCPYCGQYIMIPNVHLYELCPSCFKMIYIYNNNFLTESEYKNGEKLIYFIEEITDKIIQEVTEEEYKRWILTRTELDKKPEKQIEQTDKKRGGVGTTPKYHIKYYLEYIKQADDDYQCKLCEFIGETPRSKEKVKNHLIKCHLIKISLIKPKNKDIKETPKIRHFLKPWQDPESLFCDTKFLRQFLGKEIAKGSECK